MRLDWREASKMDAIATSSMAHMSLTLHDTYGFNAACAVDGSLLPDRTDATAGQAAWAVWRGVGASGTAIGAGDMHFRVLVA